MTALILQIGGIDILFTEILQRCAAAVPVGTPSRDAYTRGGTDQLNGASPPPAPGWLPP